MNQQLFALKARAFGIHFGISLVIFLVLLYFVVFHWYPTPFFTTDGGWQGIRLIVLVDLVLGPTLTFVAFNPIKKTVRHLKMDLSLIAICQVLALIWGTWVVHNERPYIVVFSDSTFYGLPYYQVKETGLKKEDIDRFGHAAPIKIFTDVPESPTERFALFKRALDKKVPVHFLGEEYRVFDKSRLQKLVSSSIDMNAFMNGKDDVTQELYKQFSQKYSAQIDDLLFFPLSARYGKYIVAFNKASFQFIDVLNIEPPVIGEWEGIDKYSNKLEQQKFKP